MPFQAKIQDHIAEFGHSIIAVFGTKETPGFAYTIGLTETHKCPELLVFSLPPEFSHEIVNNIVAKIKNGAVFLDGAVIDDVANLPLTLKLISNKRASPYAVQAMYRYRDADIPPSFMQIVWPDRNGLFPWAEGYDESLKPKQVQLWESHSATLEFFAMWRTAGAKE